MEKWVDIKGFEGMYKISDLGRIKSLKRVMNNKNRIAIIKEKILKNGMNPSGYKVSCLFKNRKRFYFTIHKLVITNFLGVKTDRYHQVNHIDENKLNNNIDNLEIVSPKQNILHSISKRIGENNKNSKLKEEYVRDIRKMKGILSAEKIAKIYGCTHGAIEGIFYNKTWKHVK